MRYTKKTHTVTLLWIIFVLVFLTSNSLGVEKMADRFFSDDVLHASWQQFAAQGFSKPVTGVVYRGRPKPTCGMPLGGLDTGCLDIETTGMLGYNTIFNHLVNPRLLLNKPFLGLNVGGKTWVLVSEKKVKGYTPVMGETIPWPGFDYTPRYSDVPELGGVEIADAIDYWGHYPVLDMEYKTQAPVEVGLRTFSPFIPGDTIASMLPGAIFEIQLRNTSKKTQSGTLAFSFPGFETPALGSQPIKREELKGKLNGWHIQSSQKGNALEMAYVLAAVQQDVVRSGGPLNSDGSAWAVIDKKLPSADNTQSGASLAFDFKLKPGKSKTLRLILSWYAPHWNGGGAPQHLDTDMHTHMYAKYYPSALAAADLLAKEHASLLKRIISWQEVIYHYPDQPGWLADCLINSFHMIPECSVWGQAKAPIGDWCREEDGLFGLNECPRGCPQIECIGCSFYGNQPLVYFFPKTALSTLRAYKAYQFPNGRPPWTFGGVTARVPTNNMPYGLARPDTGYQVTLNGASYIIMADRYWRIYQDDDMLKEFWDSLKRANDYCLSLRPKYGPSQVLAMPQPGLDLGGGAGHAEETEWFEAPEPGWKGYCTHAGAVRMAGVIIMRRMAQAMQDTEYIKKCDTWIDAGAKALEEHLWAGEYYLNFNEPETNTKSDLVFGYQLDGEWITDWHGLPGVFPKKRVDTTLATLRRINCQLSQSGAVNYAKLDGSPAKVGGYGTYSYFPPELMMLAMNFMYEGQKEFGMELLYSCMENIFCKWGYTWDAPNIMRGDKDTGERTYGADYYQDMMIWSVPAALQGQDLTGPSQPGGLVHAVMEAAK